jgi:hypothetical protein
MRAYPFIVLVLCVSTSACGDDGGSGNGADAPLPGGDADVSDAPGDSDVTPDAPPAPATIIVSGTASALSISGEEPVAGATIAAFRRSDESTAIATTTTDNQGNFTLSIDTGGVAVDGFLKATSSSHVDSYVYPPGPLASDTADVRVTMVTPTNYGALYAFTQVSEAPDTGVVGLLVLDTTEQPVAGATATSTPAATAKYNGSQGFPSSGATSTAADGLAYLLNAPPGAITVGAAKQGSTFASHDVKVWASSLTTTLVIQQ